MIEQIVMSVNACTCEKCGWHWRSEEVSARCPKCKAPGWNGSTQVQGRKENTKVQAEISTEVQADDDEPIEEQSPANVTPIVKERTRTPLPKPGKAKKDKPAKFGKCPHGYMTLNGAKNPMCERCKIGE